jgi:DNA-binding NarL/FixJ family response regulator
MGEIPIDHRSLSPREMEVMLAIANGEKTGATARRLCLSPKTISHHRESIMLKMGFATNAGIIRYALEHKLVS